MTKDRRARAVGAMVVGFLLLLETGLTVACATRNHRATQSSDAPPPPPPPSRLGPSPNFLPDEAAEDRGPGDLVVDAGELAREMASERAASGMQSEFNVTFGPASHLVNKNLRFVRLFYGTNRARRVACAGVATAGWDEPGRCRPNRFYGGFPAEAPGPLETPAGAGLEVGTAIVTLPPDHAPGKIERPPAIFSFDLRDEDPERDVLISKLQPFAGDYDGWVREVRATGRDQAFIYVHGFETTFGEAARRAAQVAYDLDFDLEQDFRGIPMLFSWPSRGELSATAYAADYDASEASTDAFNRFLDLVKFEAGVHRVHVIAHSMGNRVVAEALRERGARPEPILDQLVLAAPDIWASAFKSRFLHTLPKLASRVTLYVSNQDRALIASSDLRKGEPRAGQVAGGLLEAGAGVAGFEAIDASNLKNDFLGHGYYASNGSMLSDLYCLLKDTPAAGRPLLTLAGTAWRFRSLADLAGIDTAACSPPSLSVLAQVKAGWTSPQLAGGLLALSVLLVLVLLLVRRRRAARGL